jgi:hypothetical protein
MPTTTKSKHRKSERREQGVAPTLAQFAYSPREVICAAPISLSKFYLEVRDGRLIARKIGGKTVVLREDLVAWLQSLPVKTAVSERHRDQANRRWAARNNNTENTVPR